MLRSPFALAVGIWVALSVGGIVTAEPEPNASAEVRRFTGHTGMVLSVAFSPDGRYALSGGGTYKDGQYVDCTVRLWEVSSGKEVRSFEGHKEEVESVAFSPDGKYALSGGSDKMVFVWNVTTGKEVRNWQAHEITVNSVAYSPDGKYALTAGHDKSPERSLCLWDVATGREVRRFVGHTGVVQKVAFSPDGKYALSGSSDKTARLWEVATGKELQRFSGHEQIVTAIAFSPDGARVATGCTGVFKDKKPVATDNPVRLWDVKTGKETGRLAGFTAGIHSLAFSPDGKRILAGGGSGFSEGEKHTPLDCSIRLWDLKGKLLWSNAAHQRRLSSVAFSPDGALFLSGSVDGTVRLWRVPD